MSSPARTLPSARSDGVLRLLAPPAEVPYPAAADPSPVAPRWLRSVPARVLFLVLAFVALLVVTGVVGGIVRALASGAGGTVATVVSDLVRAAAALALYVGLVRLVERRPVVELAGGSAGKELLRGVAIGAGLFAAVIGVIALAGGYRITGLGTAPGVAILLSASIAAGIAEELAFRGLLFRITEELLGTWGALAISAVVFGASHLSNPGATVWGAIAIAIEAGVLLGAAYVATRRLWVPIGLHIAWNFTQGGIFGVTISGSGLGTDGLFRSTLGGPTLITGGSFGAEASLPAVLLCLAVGVAFLVLAHRTGRIRPPMWRRTGA